MIFLACLTYLTNNKQSNWGQTMKINDLVIFLLASAFILITTTASDACTRAVYLGSDNVVITGRSMDWCEDMHSNLWLFPRGIERNGAAGKNSITWASKFGSVIVSSYEARYRRWYE